MAPNPKNVKTITDVTDHSKTEDLCYEEVNGKRVVRKSGEAHVSNLYAGEKKNEVKATATDEGLTVIGVAKSTEAAINGDELVRKGEADVDYVKTTETGATISGITRQTKPAVNDDELIRKGEAVSREDGKELSENNYDDTDRNKVANVPSDTNSELAGLDSRITVNEGDIANLEAGQLSGVLYFNTYALMVAADATGQLNYAYKVIADTDTSLNGDYTSDGATYTQQTFAVNGIVEEDNVDAVSGGTVFNYVPTIIGDSVDAIKSFVGNEIDLSKNGEVGYHINYPIRAGQKIRLSITDVVKTGTGAANFNIKDSNNTYIIVANYNADDTDDKTIDFVLEDDADFIIVQMGFDAALTDFSGTTKVEYGTSVDVAINSKAITNLEENQVIVNGVVEEGNVDAVSGDTTYTAINNSVIKSVNDSITAIKSFVGDEIELSKDGEVGYHINYPIRAGQKIRLSITGVVKTGTGAANFNIKDSNNTYIIVANYNADDTDDQTIDFVLEEDADFIMVQMGFDAALTDFSGTTKVEYGTSVDVAINSEEITNLEENQVIVNGIVEEDNVDAVSGGTVFNYVPTIIGDSVDAIKSFVGNEIDLSKNGEAGYHINYPIRAGQKIRLSISGVVKIGTGNANFNIKDSNNTYIIVANYNADDTDDKTIDFVLEDDAEFIIVQIGFDAALTDFSGTTKVEYGTAVDVAINSKAIAPAEDYIIDAEKVTTQNSIQPIYYNSNGLTDFIFGTNVYFGYNKPLENDALLESVKLTLYGSTSANIGDEYEFVIGEIDQRDWLLPRITFSCLVSEVIASNDGGRCTFDFLDQKIIIKRDEVLFCVSKPLTANASLPLTEGSYDAENELYKTSSLNTPVSPYTTKNAVYFELNVVEIDSVFAAKAELEKYDSQISALQEASASINKYHDTATGELFEVKVTNGTILLQSLDFGSILTIGHSFVNYGNTPSADWYLDDGENRAMAASVNAHQWVLFMTGKLGATSSIMNGADFERNYSVDYDFATKWNVQNTQDAICVYLNENAIYSETMQASWEAMLNYLKQAAPNSKIYCTGSWAASEKQSAIQAACSAVRDVTYVDLVGLAVTSNKWRKGDYYYGRDGLYYPMGTPYTHPNDKGHLDIANGFLQHMGHDIVSGNTYNITLNQVSGGAISTPNTTWLENGIVTIRVSEDEGSSISALSVVDGDLNTITATLRTNTEYDGTTRKYYTFTMPSSDVTVTPSF